MKKFCPICKKRKAIKEFSRNSNTTDGLDSYCKPCRSTKGRRWYRKNRARKIKNTGEWGRKNKDKRYESIKRWRASHREYWNAYCRKWKAEKKRLLREGKWPKKKSKKNV